MMLIGVSPYKPRLWRIGTTKRIEKSIELESILYLLGLVSELYKCPNMYVLVKKKRLTFLKNGSIGPTSRMVLGPEPRDKIAWGNNVVQRNDVRGGGMVSSRSGDKIQTGISMWGTEGLEPLNVRKVYGQARCSQVMWKRKNHPNLRNTESYNVQCNLLATYKKKPSIIRRTF